MPVITPPETHAKTIAVRSIEVMEHGTAEDFAAVVHPEFFNHEGRDEPPETRGRGPEKARGVARWLHGAFADLHWDIRDVVAEGDLAVVRCTMSGRHTGDFVGYDVDGRVAEAFAPTGRSFAVPQTHWLRVRDGQAVEHWANRDDLGQAIQLGWAKPSPAYLLRCARAKARARRAAGPPRSAAERPFAPWDGAFDGPKEAALRAIAAMRRTPEEAFWRFGHPTHLLGESFADLVWTVHHVVAEEDLVAVHLTVAGRQVGPVASYDEAGFLQDVFPPTGRRFAVTQSHWLRLGAHGGVVDHWADRDDLGLALQLGWIPPTPGYLVRMALAKRGVRRSGS